MRIIMKLNALTKRLNPGRWLYRLWRGLLWLLLGLCLWLLVFAWLPVPGSAFMLRQDVSALFDATVPPVRHQWTPLAEIPPAMQLAVIAAEDQQFAQHWGLDIGATAAAIDAALAGRRAGGGSTITQQLAKNLFLWEERSYVRKGLEWGLAGMIELFWSKQRILEVYLNTAQFGRSEYGVGAAAQHLFNKPVSKLGKQDAALLAAVLPGPTRYNAAKPSAYVSQRQRWILRQMRQMGGVKYLEKLH